jgi:tripartite-type tricarboxylate transporter receptor subunit TctC
MGEAGLPGYEFQSWYGVWAPRGTSPEIVEGVNQLMQETMGDPAIAARMRGQLLEPVTESIAATQAFIRAEITRATALLRSVNYQPE